MATLEELKSKWHETVTVAPSYDASTLQKIIRTRVGKHLNTSIQYFWASLTLQIVVYSMLSHVVVKYWGDMETLQFSAAGFLLFIPFTIVLMDRFKKLASAKPLANDSARGSVYDYVILQQGQLQSFYNFKKWYEFMLIPLSSAIGVFLVFKLYVPGGIAEHGTGAVVTFIITILSCAIAIRSENKKSFMKPLGELQMIADEFRDLD